EHLVRRTGRELRLPGEVRLLPAGGDHQPRRGDALRPCPCGGAPGDRGPPGGSCPAECARSPQGTSGATQRLGAARRGGPRARRVGGVLRRGCGQAGGCRGGFAEGGDRAGGRRPGPGRRPLPGAGGGVAGADSAPAACAPPLVGCPTGPAIGPAIGPAVGPAAGQGGI
ncbi:MAG: hypothetical protein AVDCRST_MAG34-887, partial [uncultured Nocardioidaceae bacterium]